MSNTKTEDVNLSIVRSNYARRGNNKLHKHEPKDRENAYTLLPSELPSCAIPTCSIPAYPGICCGGGGVQQIPLGKGERGKGVLGGVAPLSGVLGAAVI